MLGRFKNYIDWADRHAESRDDDAAVCYQQSSGYCQERLGLVDHQMANHFLALARDMKGEAELDPLLSALKYER
jgi:hypothetical protein